MALAFDLRSSALEFSFDDDVFASFQVRLQPVGTAPFLQPPRRNDNAPSTKVTVYPVGLGNIRER
jgi:hypothetical protein